MWEETPEREGSRNQRKSSPEVTVTERDDVEKRAFVTLLQSNHLRDRWPGQPIPDASSGRAKETCPGRGDVTLAGSSAPLELVKPLPRLLSIPGLPCLLSLLASAHTPPANQSDTHSRRRGHSVLLSLLLSLVNCNHPHFVSSPQSINSSSQKPGCLPVALDPWTQVSRSQRAILFFFN